MDLRLVPLQADSSHLRSWSYPVPGLVTRWRLSRIRFKSDGYLSVGAAAQRRDGRRVDNTAIGDQQYPTSWSSDGRFVAYNTTAPGQNLTELWIVPTSGDRKPFAFLSGSFNVGQGQFSPDGRWMAYGLDESGRQKSM